VSFQSKEIRLVHEGHGPKRLQEPHTPTVSETRSLGKVGENGVLGRIPSFRKGEVETDRDIDPDEVSMEALAISECTEYTDLINPEQ